MLFHRLSLEAFCHATEDLDKVNEAMLNLLPPGSAGVTKVSEQKIEGSFGNEIIIVKVDFEKQNEMKNALEWIRKNLSKEDLGDFNLDEHVTDEHEFWMRFDKQAAYKGVFTLGGHDTIQLKGKVAAFPASRERAVKLMEEFWG